MAKRQADSYLTDRNWDEDEEGQEAGEFKKADETTISKRKIKTAIRRNIADGTTESTSVFKGFTGFTGLSSSTPKAAFSFGGIESKQLGLGFKPLASATSSNESGSSSSSSSKTGGEDLSKKRSETSTNQGEKGKAERNGASKNTKSKYMSQLRALNSSVVKWITEHVDSNPFCILTPIFTDYEKHLEEIERKYGAGACNEEEKKASEKAKDAAVPSSVVAKDSSDTSPVKPMASSGFSASSFGGASTSNSSAPTFAFGATTSSNAAPTFSFGASTSSSTAACSPPPAFSFGGAASSTSDKPLGVFCGSALSPSAATTSTTAAASASTASTSVFSGFGSGSSGFSFSKTGDTTTASGAFSFGTVKPAASGDAVASNEDEDYVPPEPEASSVTEEDAFYTKRCKLFYKVDSDWKDYGVGNLFLKPCENKKTQLLVRADTSLGNILLNILVPASLPVSRSGKNNVMLMCLPNPPLKEKKLEADSVVSMLVRVKTGDEADELLEKLKEAKEGKQ